MGKYEVIHFFTDLQDRNHPYKVGDIFPRDGLKVKEERIWELSGNNNRQKKPLIREIEVQVEFKVEEQENEKPLYTKTEIQRMSTDSLRILAKEVGVERPEEISGTELKKILIAKFGL